MVVHPFYLQGNADLLSYQLPQSWTNVANAWEMSCVQDYVSFPFRTLTGWWRRQGDLPWKTALFGEPLQDAKGIPSVSDARWRVETVCAGSV